MDNLEKIQKINDSIFMSNIGVLYDGIIKLDEIVCCGTKIEEAIKSAYGEENNTPMQNVLFSYIRFIKTYINDLEDAITYTKKLYYLYCSAKKLLDSSLQQIRSNLQDVAKTAGELVDSNECYIVYYDEHTQTSTEIAWDCSAGNYEDGGAYSEYIGSMLQGIHQNELKSPFDNNFFVKELNWYKNIQIIERASNIRVFSVEESNRGELGETEKTYFISIKMPIEFNKKPQNGISVYFIFQLKNNSGLIPGENRYGYSSWRFRMRSFNTFFNTLINGLSKNIGYILSEKFFYPRLEKSHNKEINLLHISDIHFAETMSFNLPKFPETEKPDLLVVTGDLVQANGNADTIAKRYELCKKELIKLAKRLFEYEWRDRVLIVPGNHDYASMNEAIANNSGRAFINASAPSIIDEVNPRVKFAYYLGFVSSFRRDFFNSNRHIEYDINYIDNRFDDWGISFLLLNSSSGVTAHRQNKVALSKSKIEILSSKLDKDKFNICLIHHTPLFNIMYIKDRSSVFGPIQDVYLAMFYNDSFIHFDNGVIINNIKSIYNLLPCGEIKECGSLMELHKEILGYAPEKEIVNLKEQNRDYIIIERIIWELWELVCFQMYMIISDKENEKILAVNFFKCFLEFAKNAVSSTENKSVEGYRLIEKMCELNSEVIGRIAQEKAVAEDDHNRYKEIVSSLINDEKVNLFMGGHQHVPAYCEWEINSPLCSAIKYNISVNPDLPEKKKIYISETSQLYGNVNNLEKNFSFNMIRVNPNTNSCSCTIYN